MIKKGLSDGNDLVWFWLWATIAAFAYGIVISAGTAPLRYYCVTALLLPVLLGQAMSEWTLRENKRRDVWPSCAVAMAIVLIFALNVKTNVVKYSMEPPAINIVADYIESNGYKYVTASYWNAGIIEGLTNGEVEAKHGDLATMTPYCWAIDGNRFFDGQPETPNIVLMTDEEESNVLGLQNNVTVMLNNHAEKVAEIGQYNLYALSENPFTLVDKVERFEMTGLPSVEQWKKTDTPNKVGFQFSNAKLNENNELVSDGGLGGCILFGPYTESVPGTYNISLNYVIDSNEENGKGVFDVALDAAAVASMEFDTTRTTVTLENVVIEAGHLFEARVWVPKGMIVRVQSIDYERVG